MGGRTDGQTERQTLVRKKETYGQTDQNIGRQTEGRTERHRPMRRYSATQTFLVKNRQTDRKKGQTNSQLYIQTSKQTVWKTYG